MNFFLETIDRWSYKILEIFKRFPLAIASALVMTILLIIFVEVGHSADVRFVLLLNKVALVASLGIFLFPALHLLSKKRWFKMTGLGLLFLYYTYLPQNVLDSTILVHHLLFVFALFFMFLWAPFMDVKISNQNIWEWTQIILQNFLVSLVLAFAFFMIFYIATLALEQLFLVSIHQRHYFQVLLFLIGLFSVIYFLATMPRFIMLVQKNAYHSMGVIFTKYLLTPSFFLYFLLLTAYVLKLFLLGAWKYENIDLLALGYVFVAIGTYLNWTPLWQEANRKFRTFLWASLFLLSLVLFYSIYMRSLVNALEIYYLTLLFSVWLFVISLYFLLRKDASYKWLFLSVSLLIVLSHSEQLIAVSSDLYSKASEAFILE